MSTIGITGGTGFVGTYITRLLVQQGHNVIIFTRNPTQHDSKNNITYAGWDPTRAFCDTEALARLDGIIHLAGAGVADKRWSDARKKEIVDSRVAATNFLTDQLKSYAPRCKTFVAASAIGYYGPDRAGTGPFTEHAAPYTDFLATTCHAWEAASLQATSFARTCIIRIGIVLGAESGAFREFVKPMKFGIKPYLGGGRQVTSWIAVEDLARLFVYAAENSAMAGIYNGVAPHPVSQAALMDAIADKMGGIHIPAPVPGFVLKMMLGEMSIEVLKSCTVNADKTLGSGFRFNYPVIDQAVEAVLKSKK
jgi:uncharacterized protein (TIGR01777 family)